MTYEVLSSTIEVLAQEGKGILAADESVTTIGKRFDSIGVENTEENRRDYRLLLATTPDLEKYICGTILFEETFSHKNADGQFIPEILAKKGILSGIKVDKGLVPLVNSEGEQVTQGLDGLAERLQLYKEKGATFAKWRNVYAISAHAPSLVAIKTGAEQLARYASICQAAGIVPIVEPEVLIDGDHEIEVCAGVCAMVLHELFVALYLHQVELEFIVLKPSMVTSGKSAKPFSPAEDIVELTLNIFRNHVPAAVPTINFLSGGQSSQQATMHLQALNSGEVQPWNLSFSYGRALQDDCLKAWGGQEKNIPAAQAALLKRAKLNALASLGDYRPDME
ncbi:MAG: fructose-bisphosphate aldolase class I [Gammaproteobacteria bacterium]|nr:fructose-bisphosphate aldolase class I [Gammaproteobacteria bacterium]